MNARRRSFLAVVTLALTVMLLSATAEGGDTDFGSTMIVGIGGAYAGALEDAGALWLNPGATGEPGHSSVSLSYRRLWELADLGEVAASMRQSIGSGVSVGAGFNRFGSAGLYQEYDALAVASFRASTRMTAGVGLHYLRTEFGDNEVAAAGAFLDAGVMATSRSGVSAGAAVRRIPVDGLYNDMQAEDPGMLYELSAAWSAPSELTIAGIWTHEEDGDNRFGIGQRMTLGAGAEFLAGLRFDPVRYTLGGQVHHGGGALHYVYQSHSDLGGTHTIGVSWGW